MSLINFGYRHSSQYYHHNQVNKHIYHLEKCPCISHVFAYVSVCVLRTRNSSQLAVLWGFSTKGAEKNVILSVLPWKRYLCIMYKLLVESLTFNQCASGCWVTFSPMEHWQILAQSQLLGATKNEEVCLDNHKSLRDSQELRSSGRISFIFYMISPLSRRGGYFIKCMETNIKSHKIWKEQENKKMRCMFQTKRQHKPPETDFSEMEIKWFTW